MNSKKLATSRRTLLLGAASLLGACCVALFTVGCSSSDTKDAAGGRTKLTVAYLGLTCEAPIFVAKEKGFYEEEGLDVDLKPTDWEGLREGLGTGRYDANHTLIMYLLKPIEGGSDIKITGGIHAGCLRVQAGIKSDIKSVKDLKGKKIGVPNLGSPPYLFCSRTLAANGINPSLEQHEVTWVTFPPAELGLALDQGKVDAVATADPIGTILIGKGQVRTLADLGADEPYKDEYCCASCVSGKLARENPVAAAKVTRALLKAARWVNENPTAAAQIGVDKKYVSASAEVNAQALAKLNYMPGVKRCRTSLDQAAAEMKKAGLLKPDTDVAALASKAWIDLDGVTDEWVNGIKVEKVAGARPRILNPVEFAALFDLKGDCVCCSKCCAE